MFLAIYFLLTICSYIYKDVNVCSIYVGIRHLWILDIVKRYYWFYMKTSFFVYTFDGFFHYFYYDFCFSSAVTVWQFCSILLRLFLLIISFFQVIFVIFVLVFLFFSRFLFFYYKNLFACLYLLLLFYFLFPHQNILFLLAFFVFNLYLEAYVLKVTCIYVCTNIEKICCLLIPFFPGRSNSRSHTRLQI